MRKFKVISLSVAALSNKIFYSGEEASEDAFPEGHVDKLVEEGFLEEIGGAVRPANVEEASEYALQKALSGKKPAKK